MTGRSRRFWGWGWEEEGPDPELLRASEVGLGYFLGKPPGAPRPRPRAASLALRAPRAGFPPAFAEFATADVAARAQHAAGRSYRDLVRTTRGRFDNPPDWVALPRTEDELLRVLEHCDRARVAVVPYGGGSSVHGGVEPDPDGAFDAAVSLDLGGLGRVLEVDAVSRAARIQAGTYGPALEDQLRPTGLTLRHYPQSFEFSTLGGWIATRAGGHFATLHTHIDDLVESLRVVTPRGTIETRRLPASGAGPQPERIFLGSEGTLGVITEAWMRLFPRPTHRASFTARFAGFEQGLRALRALAQSGLHPANCRLLDPREALLGAAGAGDEALLLVAFESGDHPVGPAIARAAELCRDAGGVVPDHAPASREGGRGEREGAAGAFRRSFLRAPYLRDELVLRDVFVETYETAVTWDRFAALHQAVVAAAERAARETGGACVVSCRVTHAYPDGAAPYYTVLAPARLGEEEEQWDAIKHAVTSAMLEQGGTTTHHHAVGRDCVRFAELERGPVLGLALSALKRALDPRGILNPGVLLPAEARARG